MFVPAAGCGSADQSKNTHLQSTIVQLESSARRDRHKMRSLENEIHVLRSELRSAEREPPSPPSLPVEVLEPERPDPAPAQPADSYDVVGYDEEGVEIIYVGDAAQDRSVRPDPLPPEWRTPAPRQAAAPAPRRAPVDIPRASDRIEVTDRVGPTVERQLREAPVPASSAVAVAQADAPRRAVEEAEAERAPAGDPRAQYRRYYAALRAGNHAFAITGFRNFIKRFPHHDFADNARYWLAEAFYDKRDYETALAEFNRVVQDYPQGNKVPDALLKIGFCHLALGDDAKARSALMRVIETFPNSKPAALATQRLDRLAQN